MMEILLEKQKNIRDLGGITNRAGRQIRSHRLIRSGRLSELTAEDASILLGQCQLRTVVDLRSTLECQERPDPQWGIVDYFRIPLLSDEQLGFGAFAAAGSPEGKMSVLDTLISMTSTPSYTPTQYMLDTYRKLVTTTQAQSAIRRFFDRVIAHGEGAVLYHCNGGKDRTGIMTALLLTALDVPWETIAADYIKTNEAVAPCLQYRLDHLPEKYRTNRARAVLRMLYLADSSFLQAAREEMCRLGNTPKGFLRSVIGISDLALEKLQERFLLT